MTPSQPSTHINNYYPINRNYFPSKKQGNANYINNYTNNRDNTVFFDPKQNSYERNIRRLKRRNATRNFRILSRIDDGNPPDTTPKAVTPAIRSVQQRGRVPNQNNNGDLSVRISEFVQSFLFPYIKGRVPNPDAREPMLTALLRELNLDESQLNEITKIALKAYVYEAFKGAYAHFSPKGAGRSQELIKHFCNPLSREKMREIIEALEDGITIDFPQLQILDTEYKNLVRLTYNEYIKNNLVEFSSLLETRKSSENSGRNSKETREATLKQLLDEELRSAEENKNWAVIQEILNHSYANISTCCEVIGRLANDEENEEELGEILSNIKNNTVNNILYHAVSNRSHLEAVRLLINYADPVAFILAFQLAVEEDYQALLDFLRQEEIAVRSESFCHAASTGCERFIAFFLDCIENQSVLEEAFCMAAANGHKTIIDSLLDRIENQSVLEEAFCMAAANGHETIIDSLLDRIENQSVLEEAFYLADLDEHEDLKDKLRNSLTDQEGPDHTDSPDTGACGAEKRLFLLAATNGHVRIIKRFSPFDDFRLISKAIKSARGNNNEKMVEFLTEFSRGV